MSLFCAHPENVVGNKVRQIWEKLFHLLECHIGDKEWRERLEERTDEAEGNNATGNRKEESKKLEKRELYEVPQ